MSSPNLMVVSHLLETQQAFASVLAPYGIAPIVASNVKEAQVILAGHPLSLIFCSDELPGDGIDVMIRQTSQPSCKVPLVVVSRCDDWVRFLDFLQAGAFDYVLFPPKGEEIERVLKSALT